jgi:2-dehydro-3-deoxygalactonokinase
LKLIALDWGTSSLRAALIDDAGHVLEERSAPRGILAVPSGGFRAVYEEISAQWPRDEALTLISGMAGSRQGWLEAPYCPCPCGFSEIATRLAWIEPGRIAVVPGVSCESEGIPDVMRGEETQVFAAMQSLGIAEGAFVLPGTHSKWVRVEGARIVDFRTFMTGEFYALLRRHSILARTLPQQDGALDEEAFARGVKHALSQASLLHAAFSVRALALFERLAPHEQAGYLSGLVIGEELRAQQLVAGTQTVAVIASPALARSYEIALRIAGIASRLVPPDAAWLGHVAIARAGAFARSSRA